jgi:hypothetical protein
MVQGLKLSLIAISRFAKSVSRPVPPKILYRDGLDLFLNSNYPRGPISRLHVITIPAANAHPSCEQMFSNHLADSETR